jgi:hypothetical protein
VAAADNCRSRHERRRQSPARKPAGLCSNKNATAMKDVTVTYRGGSWWKKIHIYSTIRQGTVIFPRQLDTYAQRSTIFPTATCNCDVLYTDGKSDTLHGKVFGRSW